MEMVRGRAPRLIAERLQGAARQPSLNKGRSERVKQEGQRKDQRQGEQLVPLQATRRGQGVRERGEVKGGHVVGIHGS